MTQALDVCHALFFTCLEGSLAQHGSRWGLQMMPSLVGVFKGVVGANGVARHSGSVFGGYNILRAFSRGMGRADAYFHAVFAGILVLGFVVAAPAADALWESLNEGVRQHLAPTVFQSAPFL